MRYMLDIGGIRHLQIEGESVGVETFNDSSLVRGPKRLRRISYAGILSANAGGEFRATVQTRPGLPETVRLPTLGGVGECRVREHVRGGRGGIRR